jgi:putative membrane protein
MSTEPVAQPPPDSQQANLALQRTILAFERTLMAWVRTGTSMITFGFALYKFYFYVHQDRSPTAGEQLFGARTFGLGMMGLGVFTLALAAWQYRRHLKALRRLYPEAPLSLSLVLAGLVGALGVFGFVAALFRL